MNLSTSDIKNIVVETIKQFENTAFVKVGISNRHIHLSHEDVEILFGKGYTLTHTKDLLQPGQYACAETLTVIGKKGNLDGVRILGPVRKSTQVELSLTDGFRIGAPILVKESGDLQDAAVVVLENPLTGARVERKCAIAALRHVHLSEEYANQFGLKDKQMVNVEFETGRGLIFKNVLLRVSKDFLPEMHLDTDEANSGGIKNGDLGRIISNCI